MNGTKGGDRLSRRSALPILSATTAVAVLAIGLIAGIALLNAARISTKIPTGVFIPGAPAGAAPTPAAPGVGGAAGPASQGVNRGPEVSAVPPTVPLRANAAARSPSPTPNTSQTYRASGSDTQVRTVAPNYPVEVSSDDQPTSDGTSSGTPSTTTASSGVVDH